MTTPTAGTPAAGASPPMTAERWRAVDEILQVALGYEPERRAAIVADACGEDMELRIEVASLLAAHVDAADDFLERPAMDALTAPDRARIPSPGRAVSARAALYAIMATLVLGLAGGVLIDRSPLVQWWTGRAPASTAPVIISSDGPSAPVGDLRLNVVDRTGRVLRGIPANRPWTPRFSPDGHRVAYGAVGSGRGSSDLWMTDLDAGVTRRLTDDENGDANDPQWSPDGTTLAYSLNAPDGKDLILSSLTSVAGRVLAARSGTQFPSDWLRDGSALLVTDDGGGNRHDIIVQPTDGSAARPYVATAADETAARISPDGHWVAYTSDRSGRPEIYIDSYPNAGRRVMISSGGGVHPAWRGDGWELYYWRDGALVAVQLGAAVGDAPPAPRGETVLFNAPYVIGLNTMYDVSRDGKQFVIVRQR